MNGYDDIDLTLQHEDDIAAYEKMRVEKSPSSPRPSRQALAREKIESAREPEDNLERARWPTAALSNSLHRINKVSLAAHQ